MAHSPRLLPPFVAFVLATLVASTPLSVHGAVSPAAPEPALASLCRAWNAVRFFHPALQDETDGNWDDAFLSAVPAVERDPVSLSSTANAMLATLHDPLTQVGADPAAGPFGLPSSEVRDGVRVVLLNGYPSDTATYKRALENALTMSAADRGIVVDLRVAAGSYEQITELLSVWASVALAAPVIAAPIVLPVGAQRYYIGFPAETGPPVSDYREGHETDGMRQLLQPAAGARAVPVAFVIDRTSVIPEEALALAQTGDALFTSDGTSGILPGSAEIIDARSGLKLAMRISAPLNAPSIAHGDLEAAIAWVRAPGKAPASVVDAESLPIKQRYASTALPDDMHRVLASCRMWGTIAYFHPYKSLARDNWDAALLTGLREVRAATSSLGYELALMKQYAHIHDSHGYMAVPAVRAAFARAPAFFAQQIEGRPTIVRVDPVTAKRDGFAPGDVIEAIDGESVAARTARLRPYIAASTEQSLLDILDSSTGLPTLLAGPAGSVATLRLRGADGHVRVVRTPRVPRIAALSARTRPGVDILAGNIGYVDLQRLEPADIDSMLARVAHTRAVVFDLRGYPRGTFWLLAPHIAASQVRVALFKTPVRRTAYSASIEGTEVVDETRDLYQVVTPAEPRLSQPLVILTDVRAISQSEHEALFLQAARQVRVVGEPTTGADGDVTNFLLPGGVAAVFSGQAILHPDGSQLQRIGIVPNILVAPSLRGVRSGTDEILLAGLNEALTLANVGAAARNLALSSESKLERADAVAQLRLPPQIPVALSPDAAPVPQDFAARGSGYEGGPDPGVRHNDGRAIALHSTASTSPDGTGSYMEAFPVENLRGKRVRISGYLRSRDATQASFWLRVDGPNKAMEAFDNMDGRALSGTADWTPFAIVLDVPKDAQQVVGGLLLTGRGTVWADDLRIDTVDVRVPTTGI